MKRLPLAVVLWLALQPLPLSAHPSAQHRIETLSEAIRAKPDEQELYLRRGQAYSNEGQLQPALADLRKAEQLGDPVLAAFDLGVVHYQLGDLQAARMLEGLESGGGGTARRRRKFLDEAAHRLAERRPTEARRALGLRLARLRAETAENE